MKVIISPKAEKQLKKISKVDQIAIANKIRSLKEQLPTQHTEKLESRKDMYRIRIGNFRVVYRKTKHEVYIVLIGHRKDIYDLLRRIAIV